MRYPGSAHGKTGVRYPRRSNDRELSHSDRHKNERVPEEVSNEVGESGERTVEGMGTL